MTHRVIKSVHRTLLCALVMRFQLPLLLSSDSKSIVIVHNDSCYSGLVCICITHCSQCTYIVYMYMQQYTMTLWTLPCDTHANSQYNSLILFTSYNNYVIVHQSVITVVSRKYAPLFCMLASGKTGQGGLYVGL